MAGESNEANGIVARPTGNGQFQTSLALPGGSIFADEPRAVGGDATGPTPYELMSAALAACTAMTLRLYVTRKEWTVPSFEVEVAHSIVPDAGQDRPRDKFSRRIAFDAPLDAGRQAKLLEIADRCPVHKTMARGFLIDTRIGIAAALDHVAAEPGAHSADMEAACAD